MNPTANWPTMLTSEEQVLAELRGLIEGAKLGEQVAEIKESGGSFAFDDRTLRNFLILSHDSPKRAFKAIKKHVAWRNKIRPDKITAKEVGVALRTGAWRVAGKTRAGGPILLTESKHFDPKAYSVDTYEKYIAFMVFRILPKLDDASDKQYICIFDLQGWNLMTHGTIKGTRMIARLTHIAQDQFPNTARCFYLLNYPPAFQTFWPVFSKLFNSEFAKKFIFVSDLKQLHETIDPSQLHVRHGGTMQHEYPVWPDELAALDKPPAIPSPPQ